MKIAFLSIFLCTSFSLATEIHSLQFGLDPLKAAVRAKKPVVVYLGNDIMAPLLNTGINRSMRFLESGLAGKQAYRTDGTPIFSDEALLSFQALSVQERKFLTDVGGWLKADLSRYPTANDVKALRSGICQKNPKYNAGLAVLRNFRQGFPMSEKHPKFTWQHCGPDTKTNLTMFEREVDTTELGETLFRFPFSEQPVTHLGLVELLLNDVMEVFPPDRFRYLFVVQSSTLHNSVLSPQYLVEFSQKLANIDEIREAFLKNRTFFLDAQGGIRKDRGFFVGLAQVVKLLEPEEPLPFGISIREFLDTIQELHPEMTVTSIRFDTNKIDFADIEAADFPAIGRVFYSPDPAPASMVFDWNKLFTYVGVQTSDIEDRFNQIQE